MTCLVTWHLYHINMRALLVDQLLILLLDHLDHSLHPLANWFTEETLDLHQYPKVHVLPNLIMGKNAMRYHSLLQL